MSIIVKIWISSYAFGRKGGAFPAVSISDEAAYRRYSDGDKAAVDLLTKKYGDPLVFYINRYIKDTYESEGLMIETFSDMLVKKCSVDEPGSFKAYLYKTAYNLALRHNQRHRAPFPHLDELSFEPQGGGLVGAKLFRNGRNLQLYHTLGKLKKEYWGALYLIYSENMSYRDTAIIMRKSKAQVTKLIYHDKQNLETFLEREDFWHTNIRRTNSPGIQRNGRITSKKMEAETGVF